jgi:hypothetical protein
MSRSRLDAMAISLARRSASIAALVCLAMGSVERAVAQVPAGGPHVANKSSAAQPSVVPTFQTLALAARYQDFTAVQLRRFRGGSGTVTAIREQVQFDGAAASAGASVPVAAPSFAVTFLAVEGELPGSPLTQKWQATYARYGSLFQLYSSFRIRDVVQASANYSLHDFGPVIRAGRSARRIVVFPASVDKSIWVVDVDDATQVPLYSAEFDLQMRLLSELEAISFVPSSTGMANGTSSNGVTFADFASARAHLGVPIGVVDPDLTILGEYVVDHIEVRTDPLNGRQKLVMGFSDGVDQVLITQSPGTSDPFAGLPSQDPQAGGHTIARFRSPTMSVLTFWDDGVSFEIAGNGGLLRLDEAARRIYVQALSN